MQNVIKFSRLSRLCDACRQIGKCVAIWRWVSPEVDTCRQMAISVAVARYRRHKNLSPAMASPWRSHVKWGHAIVSKAMLVKLQFKISVKHPAPPPKKVSEKKERKGKGSTDPFFRMLPKHTIYFLSLTFTSEQTPYIFFILEKNHENRLLHQPAE